MSQPPLAVVLALVTGVQAFATFSVVALPTLATQAAATFGLGPETVGYQISMIYVAAAVLSSVAGLVVRRIGPAMASLIAIGSAALGMLGLAAGSLPIAILASFAIGACYGLTNPAASHLLSRFAPQRRRNLIFALKQTGVPLGAVLAALTLPALSSRLGWQAAMLAGASLSLLIAIPLLLVRSRLDDDRNPQAKLANSLSSGLAVVVGNPKLRALAFMGMAYASFQFCLFTFLITMLVADFGWSLIAAGGVTTVVQISGATGRIAWSLVADHFGRGIAILVTIGVASAAIAAILAFATAGLPAPLLVLLLAAFGFCLVGWNGLWMAEIARSSGPAEVGLATGGVLVFTYIGVMAGPSAFALAYAMLGSYAWTFGAFSLLPLVGAAGLAVSGRYGNRGR